jgi:hypothetical protein
MKDDKKEDKTNLKDVVTTDFMKGLVDELNLDVDAKNIDDLVDDFGNSKKDDPKDKDKDKKDEEKKE